MIDKVRRFVQENFYVGDGVALADSDSLLERGIVDSTGVLEIVQFVEREVGVRVADDELLPENLDSVANIAAFVARKQLSAA